MPIKPKYFVFTLVLIVFSGCMEMKISQEKMSKEYPALQTHRFLLRDGGMYAVTSGDISKPVLLWVHGSPGSWTAWKSFLNDSALKEDFFQVAVDRPGFGYSMSDTPVIELSKQSALLHELLDSLGIHSNLIGVGHSMGGPVLARMAMDQPDRFKAIVLVAPAMDPDLEEIRWYNKLAEKPWFNWWLPQEMLTSNRELMPLREELIKMNDLYTRLKCKVMVIQGLKDNLVHPENEAFIRAKVKHVPVEAWLDPSDGHLIPWTHPQLIFQAINQLRK
jgi:pimeloyl-ACP methyl ester carboxylesterase